MKFSNIYENKNRPVISFEIFPPNTSNGFEKLKITLDDLASLSPDFISVTYGAMGTTRDKTLEIASYIKNQLKIETACHLTCVDSSRSEIDSILIAINECGISNIVALRGDPPKGETSFRPSENGFSHANELVQQIREFESSKGYEFGVAVAGYPEKHVEAPNFEVDLENLKRKVDAGADTIITQLFFDNDHYLKFIEKVQSKKIDIPVVPGLMPILSASQITKMTTKCGATLPNELDNDLKNAGDKIEEIGINHCIKQIEELLKNNVPGIHFYVLNKSHHIKKILKSVLGERSRA